MFIHSESDTYHYRLLSRAGVLGAVFGIAMFLPAPSTLAQDAADERLEEIVVTSRRYEESITDAPVAVGVLTAGDIENNRIDRADDIFNYTPGATYESFSKMQPVASMRGLIAPTPGNASSEASIQTAMDNVIITRDFMKSPPMYDLERVEVLRGPQGTAFGRNASVGLVHFVTKRPSQEPSASITGTVGSDERYEIDGHFNRALSDSTAFRIAFNYDEEDGQTESLSTGEGLDGEENTAIRASLLIEPSDKFSAYLKAEYSEDRDEAPVRHGYFQPFDPNWSCETRAYVYGRGDVDPGFPDRPGNPPNGNGAYAETWFSPCDDPFKSEQSPENKAGFPAVDFHTDRDILTVAAELVWNLDNDLTVTSITGYMDGETDNLQDVIGSPNDVGWQFVSNDGDSLSQEIRIDNIASGNSMRWLAGVYLLSDEETRVEQLQFQFRDGRTGEPNPPPPPSPPGQFVPTLRETGGSNETDSWSVFGEISFDIGERSTITYGGRFVRDDKDYVTGARGYGVNRQLALLPGVGPELPDGVAQICTNAGPPAVCATEDDPLGFSNHLVSDSWDDYISKLSWDYQVNDNVNVYALYSEGFKSGTFQPDALSREEADKVVAPETSTNWEFGIKGQSERYRYSVTTYFIKVEDVQTVNLVPAGGSFFGRISNIGEVESLGLEVDGTFLVTDNFLLSGNFSLIDAEMLDTPDPADSSIDISGMRPPGAPEWTYNLIGEYTFDLAGGSSLLVRADFRGRSDVFNQTSSRTGPRAAYRLRPEIADWGARITWTNANDNLAISAWGKNLAEDWDITNFGPPSPCCTTFAAGFRGKREYGITASYDF
jgi:iron complex outermembrane receptor protein